MVPLSSEVHLAVGLITLLTRSYNPPVQAPGFGLFRFRSPLLSESRLIYFPPGTEMVHFPGLARTRLWIQRAVLRFYQSGFPHSEIPGSKPACGSPGLIAACHVLRRLLAPRHPPHALSSLTIKLTQHVVPARAPRCPRDDAAPVSSPFHNALLEQNLRNCAPRSLAGERCAIASLIQLSKSVCSAPGGAPDPIGVEKKKPGIERRVNPPHQSADSRDARLLSILYS